MTTNLNVKNQYFSNTYLIALNFNKFFMTITQLLSPVHMVQDLEHFVVVIVFKKCKKKYKWWSDYVLSKIWLDFIL